MLSVVTMNVNGLKNENKRKEMFVYCKKSKFDIILMQETHCEVETQMIWKNQWGGNIIFSNGTNDERGVAILVNSHRQVEIISQDRDDNGRLIIVNVKINNKVITIANVYAPNDDQPSFFMSTVEKIMKMESGNIIIAGDFNLVLDKNLDSLNRKNNNVRAKEVLQGFMDEFLMIDIWRQINPDDFTFTWHKKKPSEIYARLDYILVNFALTTEIKNCKIKPSFRSDHSPVEIQMELNEDAPRGPGLWKINNSMLDLEYVKRMNQVFDQALDHTQDFTRSNRWEFVKQIGVKESQNFSKECAKKKKNFLKTCKPS